MLPGIGRAGRRVASAASEARPSSPEYHDEDGRRIVDMLSGQQLPRIC